MKKTLLIAFLLTFAMGTAIAQQGQRGSGPSKGNFGNSNPVERLTEQLGLDEAEAAEIAFIFEEAQALRDEERQKLQELFYNMRKTVHAQVLEVLTPEQQALFAELQQKREELRQALKDMRADRGFGGGGGGGNSSGDRGTQDCNG